MSDQVDSIVGRGVDGSPQLRRDPALRVVQVGGVCVGCPLAGVIDASQQSEMVEIGQVLTTATLERIGVEALRYRPNLVIATPMGYRPTPKTTRLGGNSPSA